MYVRDELKLNKEKKRKERKNGSQILTFGGAKRRLNIERPVEEIACVRALLAYMCGWPASARNKDLEPDKNLRKQTQKLLDNDNTLPKFNASID